MSAVFIRFGANAQDIAKRYIYSIGRNYCATSRQYSSDAATATPNPQQQNDAKDELVIKQLHEKYDKEVKGGGVVPVFKRSLLFGNKIAIRDEVGEYSYNQLLNGSKKFATQLSGFCGKPKTIKKKKLLPS